MKIKNILFCLLAIVLCNNAFGQNVTGTVRDAESGEVLVGAVVFWDKTTVGATCNVDGKYSVYRVKGYDMLIATYVGYASDTIKVENGVTEVDFKLKADARIEEVVVDGNLGNYINHESVLKGETISFAGFCKMACCNLAESFENST